MTVACRQVCFDDVVQAGMHSIAMLQTGTPTPACMLGAEYGYREVGTWMGASLAVSLGLRRSDLRCGCRHLATVSREGLASELGRAWFILFAGTSGGLGIDVGHADFCCRCFRLPLNGSTACWPLNWSLARGVPSRCFGSLPLGHLNCLSKKQARGVPSR